MMEKLEALENRHKEIEQLMSDPEVTADYSKVQQLAIEYASLKNLASLARDMRAVNQNIEETKKIAVDESDRDLATLAREELSELYAQRTTIESELRLALLPKDPNDEKNVIMEIRAGAGGEEAGLFAADLFRMYSRFAQRKGWKSEVINSNETGLGSIKGIVFQVRGEGAYSILKHESGGHRVQRVPVTESSGRVHTSAATVAVLPEADEVDVDVDTNDLEIEIFHASGHGGQNVQKVATAVRITHGPTGIMAVCQDERSQLKNKEKAMAVIRARLLDREIRRQQEEISESRRSQVGSGDRSDRVRTYNFPQDRVTDHRSSYTKHGLEEILDGDLDDMIERMISLEETRKLDEAGL